MYTCVYLCGVIMMCQDRVISCNKCITVVQDVDSGRGCACFGAAGIWELCTSLLILYKIKSIKKKKAAGAFE